MDRRGSNTMYGEWMGNIVEILPLILSLMTVITILLGVTFSVKQFKHQTKVASADLVWKIWEPWRTNNELQKLLHDIADPNTPSYDIASLERLLNTMENIAVFLHDGTVLPAHVKEFFGANLKAIKEDQFILDYIEKWNEKNPNYYFVNLKKTFNLFDKWNI